MPEYQFRAAFRSQLNPTLQSIVNVVHFSVAKLSSPFDPEDAANEIDTRMGTEYRALLTDSMTWLDLTVTSVGPSVDPPAQFVKVKNVAGTRAQADEKLSAGLCAVISLSSGVPLRAARGRFFAPPACNVAAAAEGGKWLSSNAYWTACGNMATKLSTAWTAGDDDFEPIVWSQTSLDRADATYWFPVSGAITRSEQHFLRSRALPGP